MPNVKIQSVAQTERAGLFSICFEGDSFTEFQKFIEEHRDDYSKDLGVILTAIQHMMNAGGFLERYFRPEGKFRDNVCALPIESRRLRLYCLRLSDSVLIAGNGGVKAVRRYEDCEELNGYVLTLQKLDDALRLAIRKGEVIIEERSVKGIETKDFSL